MYIELLLDVHTHLLQGDPPTIGQEPGQVLGLRPDVRLRAHRPDLRRQRRPVPGRPHQRDQRAPAPTRPARPAPYFAAVFAAVRTPVLLAPRTSWACTNTARRPCGLCRNHCGMVVVLVGVIAAVLEKRLPAGAIPHLHTLRFTDNSWICRLVHGGRHVQHDRPERHSLLSMSGFETLAQVYREIAYPKLKNLASRPISCAGTPCSARDS